MDTGTTPLVYEFGEFHLDAVRRVLRSRTDARPIDLPPRAFDTLLYLVEHGGDIVEKQALMDAVWSNVVVEEGNLAQTIYLLRRALGEQPDEHQFIVTVPKRGYRFVAEVVRLQPETDRDARAIPPQAQEGHPRSRRGAPITLVTLACVLGAALFAYGWHAWWRPAREVSPPPAVLRTPDHANRASDSVPAPSIAVLPFVDMSPEGNQQYFADGLSEEILNLLAQSAALRVIARTSSFSFRDGHADIATIAGKLNVTHVLEGSVRKAGERIRITTQLVDAATGAHLWSETYDRDVQDVFAVQKDIAASVAASLQLNLLRSNRAQAGETNSAQAFERYLQGRYFFSRRGGAADLVRARTYFKQALVIDPTYARAWADLAGTYWVGPDVGEPITAETSPKWREAIEQALRFGPDLAEAHVRAAQYYWTQGNVRRGDEHFERAEALNPSDLLVLGISAKQAIHEGRLNEGIALQRRAVARDPLSPISRHNLAVHLTAAGQWEEANVELHQALELSPTWLENYAELCRIFVLEKRFDEALTAIAQVPEGPPREGCLALVYHAMGNAAASDAALARLIAHAEASPGDMIVKLSIAEVYALRGDRDAAFTWLARAHRQVQDSLDATHPFWMQLELRLSPFLRPLSADPRWQPLFASVIDE